MTQISAEVIADSLSPQGCRLTTMRVVLPRIILAELNTHRMFSRNSASSRAIPFETMARAVREDPFIPIAWQLDHKGMQGTEYLTDPVDIDLARNAWIKAMEEALTWSGYLHHGTDVGIGVTKQLCNRLLEPFMWHTVLVSATEWENFFSLRCPQYSYQCGGETFTGRSIHEVCSKISNRATELQDMGYDVMAQEISESSVIDKLKHNQGKAEIHMMALAEAMWDARNGSKPKQLEAGEWHIPFGDKIDWSRAQATCQTPSERMSSKCPTGLAARIATARCARVSYTVAGTEGKEHTFKDDIKLHDRLAAAGHWSPFEHCAKAMDIEEYESWISGDYGVDWNSHQIVSDSHGFCGNFRGFVQYRKMFKNENRTA